MDPALKLIQFIMKILFSLLMCIPFLTINFAWNKNRIGPNDINEVKSFLNDVSNSSVSFENIIKKHLCIKAGMKDEERNEKLKWTTFQLSALRSEIQNDGQWEVVPYASLPQEKQSILIDEKEKPNIFVLQFKNKSQSSVFIWVSQGRIKSFTTINKGNAKIFVSFCP